LARSVFDGIDVFRNPAYDVAYWNLLDRPLARASAGFEVGDVPLAVFHFSGLDVETGAFVPFEPALHLEIAEGSALRELVDEYLAGLGAVGNGPAVEPVYEYPAFDNGVPSDHVLQTLYATLSHDTREKFGDPFRTGSGSFLEWALGGQGRFGVPPYFLTLYELRSDLQAAFSLNDEPGREAFAEWTRTSGVRENPSIQKMLYGIPWLRASAPATLDAAP
jgi:hypothetical protein